MWALGAVVYWLGVHVMLGALREARRDPGLRQNWFNLLIAGLAIGSAVCAGTVVSLTGNTMAFALGFGALMSAGVLVASWLGGLIGVLCVGLLPRWFGKLSGGLILGGMATAVQIGWMVAAGFRPGLRWQPDSVGAAFAAGLAGALIATFMAFSAGAQSGSVRNRWRLAASGLMAGALVGSQELLIAGSRLGSQVGSVFQNELPAPALSLVFGAVVPLLLVVAALDLGSSRRHRGDLPGAEETFSTLGAYPPGSSRSSSGKRRRRRHRIRNL